MNVVPGFADFMQKTGMKYDSCDGFWNLLWKIPVLQRRAQYCGIDSRVDSGTAGWIRILQDRLRYARASRWKKNRGWLKSFGVMKKRNDNLWMNTKHKKRS